MAKKPDIYKETFHNANGETPTVNIISLPSRYYCENEDGAAADVHYANKAFYLRVYVPAEGVSVEKALSSLRALVREEFNAPTNGSDGKVKFPIIDLSQRADITPILKGCGITRLLDKDLCEMDGVIDGAEMFLNKLKQNTEVRIDENGTEIKASSSGEILVGTTLPPFYLKVDRPFAFEIRATDTNVVILQGRVNNL